MDITPEIFNAETKTPLTGEQFITYKLALNKIILSITQEIIPALKQQDPERLAGLPLLTQDTKKNVESINSLTSNDAVKDAGSEILNYLPAFATACHLGDFNTAFVFKNMLSSYYTAAHNSLKRRVKFQIE